MCMFGIEICFVLYTNHVILTSIVNRYHFVLRSRDLYLVDIELMYDGLGVSLYLQLMLC